MSREVKTMEGPLSEDDRAYLESRGRDAEVKANEARFGNDDDIVGDDDVRPYEQWTKPELEAEIQVRNKDGRPDEQKMALSGNKDSLVARLYQDDTDSDD